MAYCQCASALILGNKALFASVDLIGEKNQVILEWMFTIPGRDEVLMAWHMHKDVLAIFAQGRIQGEAK